MPGLSRHYLMTLANPNHALFEFAIDLVKRAGRALPGSGWTSRTSTAEECLPHIAGETRQHAR